MLRPKTNELERFYNSRLGKMAGISIRSAIRKAWPEMFEHKSRRDENILGCGYALPYLKMFLLRSQRVMAAMPGNYGAVFWPENNGKNRGRNLAFSYEDTEMPLPDASISRAIIIHSLEFSDNLTQTMRELWRVLTPEGRVILIVPNRKGLWARADSTPFGHGIPFSGWQMEMLLNETMFDIISKKSALFMLPITMPWLEKIAKLMEWVGKSILPRCGGVLVIEAQKRIYATVEEGVENPKKVYSYKRVVGY